MVLVCAFGAFGSRADKTSHVGHRLWVRSASSTEGFRVSFSAGCFVTVLGPHSLFQSSQIKILVPFSPDHFPLQADLG